MTCLTLRRENCQRAVDQDRGGECRKGDLPTLRTRWLGATLLAASVLTAGAAAATPASGGQAVDSALELISTPDDPLGGGRHFDLAQPGFNVVSADELVASFTRIDGTGSELEHDPTWQIAIDPTEAIPGSTVALGPDSDALRLGRTELTGTRWMDEICPDITGEVTFSDVSLDVDGTPLSLAAQFTLVCSEDDAIYGATAFNAAQPELPIEAASVITTDSDYPAIGASTGIDGAGRVAVRMSGDDALMRWDSWDGFVCSRIFVTQIGGAAATEPYYIGLDDTTTLTTLDPEHSYWIGISLASYVGSQFSCHDEDEEVYLEIHSVDVALADGDDVRAGNEARIHGSVAFPNDSYEVEPGPAPNVKVQLWGQRNGVDVMLGQTRSDGSGRFTFEFGPDRSTDVHAVVPSGHAGWGRRLTHFGATSGSVPVRVSHSVRSWVLDPTRPKGSRVTVMADLTPSDESLPLRLERKSRDGAWIPVDTVVSKPDTTSVLHLPQARQGWQALRVVAPNDGWHTRGASQRLRVLGY